MTPITPVPKPLKRRAPKKAFSSIAPTSYKAKVKAIRKQRANATPIRKKPRPDDETLRIYGPPVRRGWMTSLPCLGCGIVGHSEQAHVITGGKGRKADARFCVPLCRSRVGINGCHWDFDHAKRSWPAAQHLDMRYEAAKYELAWQEISGGTAGGSTP